MGRVVGKVALVTGAGSGIGRACALTLAREGAQVLVLDCAPTGAATSAAITAAGGQAQLFQGDIGEEAVCTEAVAETMRAFGRLDILVNCAGIYPRYSLADTTTDVLDRLFQINFYGPLFLAKHAIPAMQRGGGGSIINIGSIHGLCGSGDLVAYAATKGALLTLTRTLARTYARDQIRVNYVIPGWVLTEGELATQAQEGHDEAWLRQQGTALPTGRIQLPQDAANAVLFLASDESSQLNAAIINTDGGRTWF
ncbi:MAG: glucose 1-dehydrogenase [Chloroflexi bacterium]|nr:glucose 1-dehydrogenase [Chloroflexota bacterium]